MRPAGFFVCENPSAGASLLGYATSRSCTRTAPPVQRGSGTDTRADGPRARYSAEETARSVPVGSDSSHDAWRGKRHASHPEQQTNVIEIERFFGGGDDV